MIREHHIELQMYQSIAALKLAVDDKDGIANRQTSVMSNS